MDITDTIAAIATAPGEAGIGMIRISGKGALGIADQIFVSPRKIRPSRCPTHTVHYGMIRTRRGSRRAGMPAAVDEVLLTVMRRPRTYTREDVVEISCHGGMTPVRRILELVLQAGARLAQPGEFTQRAFLNGRIDLVQAEAVLHIIRSRSEAALTAAVHALQGELSRRVALLRERLISCLAPLDAAIDFPEEHMPRPVRTRIRNSISDALARTEGLLRGADKGIMLQQGISAVLLGCPNVGKSSLMNALVEYERAIVTHIPGTTRDVIEETITVHGVPVRLADTAGIMSNGCAITRASVQRSLSFSAQADLIILVVDAARPRPKAETILAQRVRNKPVIIVLNKIDRKPQRDLRHLRDIVPGARVIRVCALTGVGLAQLRRAIRDAISSGTVSRDEHLVIANLRQKNQLEQCRASLRRAQAVIAERGFDECLAFELKCALGHLNALTGADSTEEVLTEIFTQFCIGK